MASTFLLILVMFNFQKTLLGLLSHLAEIILSAHYVVNACQAPQKSRYSLEL